MTALAEHIQRNPIIDTHEHLQSEQVCLDRSPDILRDLFDNYVTADLIVAGASQQAVDRALNTSDPDLAGRFAGIQAAWECCRHTGYGEAVRLIAKLVYEMDEITPETLAAAAPRTRELYRPGVRLRLLRDIANLDHVQIDNFTWECPPDPSGPEFFLYDLSWVGFAQGKIDAEGIFNATGVHVSNTASLRQGIAGIFAHHGPTAIAVKSQHAYDRTLLWRERSDAEAEPLLQKALRGIPLELEERLCLGDWCLARGVEQAIEQDLPFKIHTGYYAGYGTMPVDRIRAGHLCELLQRYPAARFVLMHTAYPYSAELAAMAKHYPNVYVDMCWAWSIDPYSAVRFVHRMIHSVPINKLFVFGGDTFWPSAAVAYVQQARTWLARALQAEIDDGLLNETEAIRIADRLMFINQTECFDLAGRRATIAARMR